MSESRNEELARLRARKIELEGFRNPTAGTLAEHMQLTHQIWALLKEGQDG